VVRLVLLSVLILPLIAACSGLDGEQARICRAITPVLEPAEVLIRIDDVRAGAGRDTVEVRFTPLGGERAGTRRALTCAFGGGLLSPDRLRPTAVESDGEAFNWAQLALLERFWLRMPGSNEEAARRIVEGDRRGLTGDPGRR